MKSIKRFMFVLVIAIGLLFVGAEPDMNEGLFPQMFIGGCFFLFAWGLWENCSEIRDWLK